MSSSSGSGRTLAPPISASQQFASAPIEYGGAAVGSVRIWVYGSETLLTQADEQFSNNSYQAMVFATVLAIVLASCIGFLFARTLVRPVNTMAQTARAIKEGDLSARTGIRGEDEIARLGMTFDEMADSIERDRKLERRLTTDVAHELRTPLMAIQATVEAMVDGVFDADEERLETVNGEVKRLSRLVDAILKLSRLENRSTPMKKEVLEVGDLISGIIATHEAYVSDSGLKLIYEVEPRRARARRRGHDSPGNRQPHLQRGALHTRGRYRHRQRFQPRGHVRHRRARHGHRPFARRGEDGVLPLLARGCRGARARAAAWASAFPW